MYVINSAPQYLQFTLYLHRNKIHDSPDIEHNIQREVNMELQAYEKNTYCLI